METQEKIKYTDFKIELEQAVDTVYNSNQGSTIVFSSGSRYRPLMIPKGIKSVCFGDETVSFEPEKFPSFNVKKLKGDGCIKVASSGLSFTLENKAVNGGVVVLVS